MSGFGFGVGTGRVGRAFVAMAFVAILAAACGGSASPKPSVGPPNATPLANPPAEPVSSGATATIHTDLGDIVFEIDDGSSPVAAQNFVNLANAGYYDGTVFH